FQRADAEDFELLAVGEVGEAAEKRGRVGPIRAPAHLFQQIDVAAQLLSDLVVLGHELRAKPALFGLRLRGERTERPPLSYLPSQAYDHEQRDDYPGDRQEPRLHDRRSESLISTSSSGGPSW